MNSQYYIFGGMGNNSLILESKNYKKQGETVESALEKVAAQFKMPKGNIELIKRAWSAGGIIVSF